MYQDFRKCEPVYFWAVTAPSHPSFGADTSNQCSNRPNGQTVPRLAVWTVRALGGDALRVAHNAPIFRGVRGARRIRRLTDAPLGSRNALTTPQVAPSNFQVCKWHPYYSFIYLFYGCLSPMKVHSTARSKPRYSESRIPGEVAWGSLQLAVQGGLNGPVRTVFITQKHADCRYCRAFRRGYGGPGIDEIP